MKHLNCTDFNKNISYKTTYFQKMIEKLFVIGFILNKTIRCRIIHSLFVNMVKIFLSPVFYFHKV